MVEECWNETLTDVQFRRAKLETHAVGELLDEVNSLMGKREEERLLSISWHVRLHLETA